MSRAFVFRIIFLIPLSTFQQFSVLCFLTWTLIKKQPSRLWGCSEVLSACGRLRSLGWRLFGDSDGTSATAGPFWAQLLRRQRSLSSPWSTVLQTRVCNLFNSFHLFPCNLRQQQQPACYCRRCCFITDSGGGGGGVATAARLPRQLVFVALCGMFVHYPLTE